MAQDREIRLVNTAQSAICKTQLKLN